MHACGHDFHIERKNINIYDAKGNKDRIVYMAEDMAALLKQYLGSMDPTISTENRWLFPGVNPDNHISSGALAIKFNEFWNETPYANTCEKRPTIHALRHTYVVLRMNIWMENDIDLNIMMPYLSRQLGHKSVQETFYYYHQVAEAFRAIHRKDTVAHSVLPKVRIR